MSELLDNFNTILEEFILKSISTFPDEPKIRTYYRMFSISRKYNKQLPIKVFMGGCMHFKDQIKNRDSDFFMNRQTFVEKCVSVSSFSDDLGIRGHWSSLSNDTKKNIWDYVQTLYVLGENYINGNKDIIKQINNTYENLSLTELKRFESSSQQEFSPEFLNKISSC